MRIDGGLHNPISCASCAKPSEVWHIEGDRGEFGPLSLTFRSGMETVFSTVQLINIREVLCHFKLIYLFVLQKTQIKREERQTQPPTVLWRITGDEDEIGRKMFCFTVRHIITQ